MTIICLLIGAGILYLNTLFLYRAGKVVQEYRAKLNAVKAAQGHMGGEWAEMCAKQFKAEKADLVLHANQSGKRLYISYYN